MIQTYEQIPQNDEFVKKFSRFLLNKGDKFNEINDYVFSTLEKYHDYKILDAIAYQLYL